MTCEIQERECEGRRVFSLFTRVSLISCVRERTVRVREREREREIVRRSRVGFLVVNKIKCVEKNTLALKTEKEERKALGRAGCRVQTYVEDGREYHRG